MSSFTIETNVIYCISMIPVSSKLQLLYNLIAHSNAVKYNINIFILLERFRLHDIIL